MFSSISVLRKNLLFRFSAIASNTASTTPASILNQQTRRGVISNAVVSSDVVPPLLASLVAADDNYFLFRQFNSYHQQQQRRSKHSVRQIKRIFRKNPARLRVEERTLGINRNAVPETLPPPKFPPVFEPKMLSNGWSAPPPQSSSDGDTCGIAVPEYPFQVSRTRNKPNDAVGFLPVYVKYRKDGTKATTRIKRVKGDRDVFLDELRSVLDLPAPLNGNPRDDAIRIRTGGTIEVNGNRVREVKLWLAGLGF